MLTEQDITAIVTRVISSMKNAKGKHAVWGEAYKEACEHAEAIEIHCEMGNFPEKLMRAKAPNETEAETKYRRDSFESITVPYWHRAENSLNRIWAEQNYKIDWPDVAEGGLKKYFTAEYPVYENVISYFQSVVTKQKIRDPNSVLVVGFDIPLKVTASGETVVDNSVELAPYATIYDSDDVLMYKEAKMALVCSDEKTMIEAGNGKVNEGHVFYLYDDTNIYRIWQVGKKSEPKFNYQVYHNHNLGYCPAWKLKGIPADLIDGNPLYNSYFMGALPHLNKAIKLDSTLDASISKIAYPIRTYYEQKCPNAKCSNGKIYSDDPSDAGSDCPTCSGKGMVGFSPLRDHVLDAPNLTDATDKLPFPALAYVSPPSEILDFNQKKIEKDIVSAFQFINIDVSSKATGQNPTATEVTIDRDELYTFLLTISNELYQLLSRFMNTAARLRYMDLMNDKAIAISPPQTFDLRTPAELTTEVNGAKTAGLPAVGFNELKKEWIAQRFNQHSHVIRIDELVTIIDAYANCTNSEVAQLKSSGIIPLWKAILHYEILSYIEDERIKNSDFLSQPIDKIRQILYKRAQASAAAMNVVNPDSILANIAGGNTGNELANSVGGLTGMIEIVKAVASGVYDLEAAVALVSQRFGISEDEARKQLGTPQLITNPDKADTVSALT